MSRADYWICPVCDRKALYDDSTEDAPDYCRPVTVVHDECLELLTARAAADERAKVAEEIAKAILAAKPSPAQFWDSSDTARVFALNDAARIARGHATHASNTDLAGEQQREGGNGGPQRHAEPRTGVAASNDTNTAPEPAQTV